MTGVHNLHMDDASGHSTEYEIFPVNVCLSWVFAAAKEQSRAERKRVVRCHKPGRQMTTFKGKIKHDRIMTGDYQHETIR